MNSSQAQKIASDFWACINKQDWSKARSLLSNNFTADWPQSKEKIISPDNFISINRDYPGQHSIKLLQTKSVHPHTPDTQLIVTEVFIESIMPNKTEIQLFAISFFEIKEDKIISLKEYWAETYQAPEWRKHLASRY